MRDPFAKLTGAAHSGAFALGAKTQPSPDQVRAGNYKKGSLRLQGLPITIETPMFTPRTGKSDGKPWSIVCMANYGYINGTKAADGDAFDVYVGPTPESQLVVVVNQTAKDGGFDEHKAVLGFHDQQSALAAYMNSYERGWKGLGSFVACTMKQFKAWLKAGDLTRPLVAADLIDDEECPMSVPLVSWSEQNQPVGQSVGDVIYAMRREDKDGLLLDSATMADIEEDLSDGTMLDALVIEYAQFQRKANQLLKVMQLAGASVKAETVEVSKPFKNRGTTQVAMLFGMTDGQSVSVFFHNPDTTPNKLTTSDELISWKWVLNKKDITITVAPEKGQDLNPRQVARRVMTLVEKNSARFLKAAGASAEKSAQIETLKAQVETRTGELQALDAQIVELTAKRDAKKAAEPAESVAAPGVTSSAPSVNTFFSAASYKGYASGRDKLGMVNGWGLFNTHLDLGDGTYSLATSYNSVGMFKTEDAAREWAKANKANAKGHFVSAAPAPAGSTILEDYADVAALGSATVASVGSENVYFEKDGAQYMTKLLNTDDYEDKVGQVVDLSGVTDPSAAPAPTEPAAEEVQPDMLGNDPSLQDSRTNLEKLTDALKAGNTMGALGVLDAIENVDELRELVLRAGFSLGASGTKDEILAGVGKALVRAAKAKTDGFGLRELDKAPAVAPTRSQAVKQALAALGWTTDDKSVFVELATNGATYQLRQSYEGKSDALVWKDTGSNLQWNDEPAMSADQMAAKIDNEFRAALDAAMKAAREPLPPAVDEESVILQGPAGPVTVAKTKYVETGEWGVSWASTHIASAASKAEGVAIAERVIASGAEDIAGMRAAVTAQAPAAEPETYPAWETAVVDALAQLMGIDSGDAQGVIMAHDTLLSQLYVAQRAPAEAAQAVADAARGTEPGEGEDTGKIAPEGRENTVKTAKGTKVVTGFKVIEAKNLIISHEVDGTPNPDYPSELQPRDRARATSQAWVQKTARSLDPDSLGRTNRADSGAPIVGSDRVVESGNGRAMAIREAYRIGQAGEYREWLEENAEYFKVDPAKIARMKAPILVRVRVSKVNRAEFAVEANQDDKLAMTATEKARSDAKRLDAAMLAKLADGDLSNAANRDFIASFLQSLGDAESAQYLTTDGRPTSSLINRVQAALFAGAYSDDRLLELTADVSKPEIANIVSALNAAAPDFMRAKEMDITGAEDAGERVTDSVELSLNQEAVGAIINATNMLRQAKESRMGLDEFLRQGDMFGDVDPAVAAMAMFIQQNNRSAKRLGTAFKAMAQFVETENARKQTAGLFGDAPASFTDIVKAANTKLEQEYGEGVFAIGQDDLFSQPATPSAAEPAAAPVTDEKETAMQAAKDYLDTIIDGTADLSDHATVLKEVERIYETYNDELGDLVNQAAEAFSQYALKQTADAF